LSDFDNFGHQNSSHHFPCICPSPTITNIVNFSLTFGQFHPILKESVISLLLKKSTLDKDELSNYPPISNLTVISKIKQCIVKSRLIDHFTSNKIFNPHQSAYCKHHSMELWDYSALQSRLSHQCNRITKSIMPLPS